MSVECENVLYRLTVNGISKAVLVVVFNTFECTNGEIEREANRVVLSYFDGAIINNYFRHKVLIDKQSVSYEINGNFSSDFTGEFCAKVKLIA